MRLFRLIKIASLVFSTIFLISTLVNVVLASLMLGTNLTRTPYIDFGFHIVFMLPFVPFLFGVAFELREFIVPFMLVTLYSTILDTILIVLATSGQFDPKPFKVAQISFTLGINVATGLLCAVFIILLFHKITSELKKRDAAGFVVDHYVLRRFGIGLLFESFF